MVRANTSTGRRSRHSSGAVKARVSASSAERLALFAGFSREGRPSAAQKTGTPQRRTRGWARSAIRQVPSRDMIETITRCSGSLVRLSGSLGGRPTGRAAGAGAFGAVTVYALHGAGGAARPSRGHGTGGRGSGHGRPGSAAQVGIVRPGGWWFPAGPSAPAPPAWSLSVSALSYRRGRRRFMLIAGGACGTGGVGRFLASGLERMAQFLAFDVHVGHDPVEPPG